MTYDGPEEYGFPVLPDPVVWHARSKAWWLREALAALAVSSAAIALLIIITLSKGA